MFNIMSVSGKIKAELYTPPDVFSIKLCLRLGFRGKLPPELYQFKYTATVIPHEHS